MEKYLGLPCLPLPLFFLCPLSPQSQIPSLRCPLHPLPTSSSTHRHGPSFPLKLPKASEAYCLDKQNWRDGEGMDAANSKTILPPSLPPPFLRSGRQEGVWTDIYNRNLLSMKRTLEKASKTTSFTAASPAPATPGTQAPRPPAVDVETCSSSSPPWFYIVLSPPLQWNTIKQFFQICFSAWIPLC